MPSRKGESTSNCYENGSTSTENKQVTEQCLRGLRRSILFDRFAFDLRIYACGAIREESIYSDLVSGTLQLIASTMNLIKLRGIFSALTNGRRIWFWYIAVAVAATLPVQIHRSAVRYQAVYGKVDAMTKAAREAALAPKPGEWVSPFCRTEYQDFWPDALRNPALDPICKRQVEAFIAHCQQDAKKRSASWDKTTGKYLHRQDPACDQ